MAPRGAPDLARLQEFLGEDEPVEVEPGAIVGQVRLERVLREGGMGSVWLGTHLTLGSQVAVKFMASRLAGDPEARRRFSREAAAAAQIKSTHVVRILDHGFADGALPFIVMELLDGEDLAARLERAGRLDLAETEQIITQIARALKTSHELGIVHRDIKPANVFLTEQDGQTVVKLLDFGIAKRADADATASTATGSLIGTPFYMSPEHVLSAKAVDERADLWSLAVVAYESLTGSVPFGGETIGAVSIAIDRGVFDPPSSRRPELSPAIDAWFARALARDASARFASARELAESFSAAIAGTTPADEPKDPDEPATPTAVAPPRRVWPAAVAAIAAVSVATLLVRSGSTPAPLADPPEMAAAIVTVEPVPPPAPVATVEAAATIEPVTENVAPPAATTEVPIRAARPATASIPARPRATATAQAPAASSAPAANPFTGRY